MFHERVIAVSQATPVPLLPEPPAGARLLVDTPGALAAAAPEIRDAGALALDVEAGKPRGAPTAVAALIQIAAPGRTWLIDPLRLAGRLAPLDAALRANTGPVAVFDAPGDVRWLETAGVHLAAAIDLLQVTRSAYGERDKSLREALRPTFASASTSPASRPTGWPGRSRGPCAIMRPVTPSSPWPWRSATRRSCRI